MSVQCCNYGIYRFSMQFHGAFRTPNLSTEQHVWQSPKMGHTYTYIVHTPTIVHNQSQHKLFTNGPQLAKVVMLPNANGLTFRCRMFYFDHVYRLFAVLLLPFRALTYLGAFISFTVLMRFFILFGVFPDFILVYFYFCSPFLTRFRECWISFDFS